MKPSMGHRKTKFLFDHIPKTAGTSLHLAFRTLFTRYSSTNNSSHMHLLQQADSNYVGGHIHFFNNEALSPEHYYCTVLRDPVQRFLSEFMFHRQTGQQLLAEAAIQDRALLDWQVLCSLRMSLSDYVGLNDRFRMRYSNVQATHFAARLSSNPYELDEKSLVDAAIACLEGYDLIGSFDNLQGFLDGVARDFGFKTVLLEKMNVTRHDPERENIPRDTLDVLEQVNSADYKILHWAAQRFGWKLGSSPKSLISPVERVTVPASPASAEDVGFVNKRIKIVEAKCCGAESGSTVVAAGEPIILDVDIDASVAEKDLNLGIAIHDREGRLLYGVNSYLLGRPICIAKPGRYKARITLENRLNFGAYSVTLAMHKGLSHTDGFYDWLDSATAFAVVPIHGQLFEGIVDCRAEIFLLDATGHG